MTTLKAGVKLKPGVKLKTTADAPKTKSNQKKPFVPVRYYAKTSNKA